MSNSLLGSGDSEMIKAPVFQLLKPGGEKMSEGEGQCGGALPRGGVLETSLKG